MATIFLNKFILQKDLSFQFFFFAFFVANCCQLTYYPLINTFQISPALWLSSHSLHITPLKTNPKAKNDVRFLFKNRRFFAFLLNTKQHSNNHWPKVSLITLISVGALTYATTISKIATVQISDTICFIKLTFLKVTFFATLCWQSNQEASLNLDYAILFILSLST